MAKAIMFCGRCEGERVYAEVVDLDGFVKAGPDEEIFVDDGEGRQSVVKKGDVTWEEVQA